MAARCRLRFRRPSDQPGDEQRQEVERGLAGERREAERSSAGRARRESSRLVARHDALDPEPEQQHEERLRPEVGRVPDRHRARRRDGRREDRRATAEGSRPEARDDGNQQRSEQGLRELHGGERSEHVAHGRDQVGVERRVEEPLQAQRMEGRGLHGVRHGEPGRLVAERACRGLERDEEQPGGEGGGEPAEHDPVERARGVRHGRSGQRLGPHDAGPA